MGKTLQEWADFFNSLGRPGAEYKCFNRTPMAQTRLDEIKAAVAAMPPNQDVLDLMHELECVRVEIGFMGDDIKTRKDLANERKEIEGLFREIRQEPQKTMPPPTKSFFHRMFEWLDGLFLVVGQFEIFLPDSKPTAKKVENNSDHKTRCRCRGHGAPEIIDPCIRELVDCLNRHGVSTISSCCGHGDPGNIVLAPEAIEKWKGGAWLLKLSQKEVVLPYDDKRCEWADPYPTGGRNFSGVCHKLNMDENANNK